MCLVVGIHHILTTRATGVLICAVIVLVMTSIKIIAQTTLPPHQPRCITILTPTHQPPLHTFYEKFNSLYVLVLFFVPPCAYIALVNCI